MQERTRGCVNCGRGEINANLLPPPFNTIDTTLELVACPEVEAHIPPSGRHVGRCAGFVYQHRNPRICAAVKTSSPAPKLYVSSGGN